MWRGREWRPPWKVLRGRRSGSPGDSGGRDRAQGRGLGWTPGGVTILGKARWVLGGVRISEKEEVRVLLWQEGAWQQETKEMEKERSGKEERGGIPPAALGNAHTVPRRLRGCCQLSVHSVAKRTPLVIRAVLTGEPSLWRLRGRAEER